MPSLGDYIVIDGFIVALSPQVLMNNDGTAVDLVTVLLAESHVLLLSSPGSTEAVLEWIAIQAKEGEGLKVAAADVSSRCVMLSLIGPEAEAVLKELAGVRGRGAEVAGVRGRRPDVDGEQQQHRGRIGWF